jgi:hypothetical protein
MPRWRGALAHAKVLRDEGKNLRKIADTLASKFNLKSSTRRA